MDTISLLNYLEDNSDNIINTVNNIVYDINNDFKSDINTELKNKLKSCFVRFFGEHHASQVEERINNMSIYKCYHIWGSRNSLSKFLLEEKARNFNKNRNIKIFQPETLEYYMNTPCEQLLEDAELNTTNEIRLDNMLYSFKIDLSKFKKYKLVQNLFKKRVQKTYNEYLKTPYSDDPQINEKMLFIEDYIEKYKEFMQRHFDYLGMTLEDYKDNISHISTYDIIFSRLAKMSNKEIKNDIAQMLFCPDGNVSGFAYLGDIFLGIYPETPSIIHEVFHAVTTKLNSENVGVFYNENQRYFNEAVTEYYSQIINKLLLADYPEGLTINCGDVYTSYEKYLFKHIKEFLHVYEPEFKECLMREEPVIAMKSIIGEKEFDTIAENCDIVFRLGYDANCYNFSKIFGEEISDNAEYLINKKSPIEIILNNISNKAELLANILKGSKPSHLKRFANSIYALSEIINTHTQKKVSDRLNNNLDHQIDYDDYM